MNPLPDIKGFEFCSLEDVLHLKNKQLDAVAKQVLRTRTIQCAEVLKNFITVDEETKRMLKQVRLLSITNDSVIINGESGTGKETIAKALHNNRPGRFVAFNCTALPEQLVESILFGHIRGTFTGAETDKMGLMEYATNGTLFIDEIGDMPLTIQAKLLRALQERTIRPLGSLVERKINNIRIIAATHQNLLQLVEKNLFRLDLYWRLNTHNIRIKPLSERREDILEIISYYDKDHTLTDNDKVEIANMPLKGNVRELISVIERYKLNKTLTELESYL